MGTPQRRMVAFLVLFFTAVSCASVDTKAKTFENHGETQNGKTNLLASPIQNHKFSISNRNTPLFLNLDVRKDNILGMVPKKKTVSKREVKKPKNKKRNKKFNKKEIERKMQKKQEESKSKSESKQSKTEETEESETLPDDDSSDYDSDSDSSYTDDSKSEASSTTDDKTESTEEITLTSEEESDPSASSEEIYSGPDSSPPDSSDSTDESSASRAIPPGSSEVSYTLSSDASVYSSSGDESSESKTQEGSDKEKNEDSKEASKSKVSSKSAIPKVKTKIKKKKGKKTVKIDIKLKNNNVIKGRTLKMDPRNRDKHMSSKGKEMKVETKDKKLYFYATTEKTLNVIEKKVEVDEVARDSKINIQGKKLPLNYGEVRKIELKTSDNQRNFHQALKQTINHQMSPHMDYAVHESLKSSKEQPKMEMLKVKKAEIDPKKKIEDLEHDLQKDYPVDGSVEIVNWEGTFAPIVGEPYVAPVHHQPDSFWDAIYTSKDPDLPTPAGADVDLSETPTSPLPDPPTTWRRPVITTLHPSLRRFIYVTNEETSSEYEKRRDEMMEMAKDKDKGGKKTDKKKPKLSPKEKKQKKREKKQEKKQSRFSGAPNPSALQLQKQVHASPQGLSGNPGLQSKDMPAPIKIHAARKSEENLKTPSEEERESGTTYKPEGAYEYPSFRHPDFNPDTAYDENGIPIHESPGWTPPPTLPGDRRFGKERNRASAAGKNNIGHVPLAIPQVAKSHVMDLHQSSNLHAHIAAQEHQHLAETLQDIRMDPHKLTDPDDHNGMSLILPAQHQGAPINENGISHNIIKRKAAISGSMESVDSVSRVMTSEELKSAASRYKEKQTAKEYKAYKLTDSELMNKEKSAPLEALNPALFAHRNMLHVKKKEPKVSLKNFPVPSSAELIAVIVRNKDGSNPKCHIHNKILSPISKSEEPVEYDRKNEALNPNLYKHRNMFKVSDIKDDGMKITKEDVLQEIQKQSRRFSKPVPVEEFINGPHHTLRGRHRENFNPVFINEKNLFRVKTNKFKANSIENRLVKREVKEASNPALYSFQNIFSSNPKQIMPLKNNKKHKNSPKQFLPMEKNQVISRNSEDFYEKLNGFVFGRKVPVIDEELVKKKLDPKVKQYIGRKNEALNPYLINYANMFKANYALHKNHAPEKNVLSNKKNNLLYPDVNTYTGRKKENLNPHLYKYPNMFSVDKTSLDKKDNTKQKTDVLGGRLKRNVDQVPC